jgi:hypothetical protein
VQNFFLENGSNLPQQEMIIFKLMVLNHMDGVLEELKMEQQEQ